MSVGGGRVVRSDALAVGDVFITMAGIKGWEYAPRRVTDIKMLRTSELYANIDYRKLDNGMTGNMHINAASHVLRLRRLASDEAIAALTTMMPGEVTVFYRDPEGGFWA
jgi:hypothetical protein